MQTQPLDITRLQRVAFRQPVGAAQAAAKVANDNRGPPEAMQPRGTASFRQPRVCDRAFAILHSRARFAGHRGNSDW
ncbi:hypothetical protein BCAR13_90062 [Paraburkholderia caribensis]|nr:hypothetical protein BCAR13_90062 [Paraburkholderia caribensis]